MSLGTQIAWDDAILPFQLDRADIRGRFVRLTRSLDEVLSQHAYPPTIEALVAEATLLTALIGQTVKLRWKLSLQVRGSGAVKLIATDYYAPKAEGAPAQIRAYASFDADEIDPSGDSFAQVGGGYFGIMIDQGPNTAPYQGITPLSGGSLASCAETYFSQSEQIPTRFALTFGTSSDGQHDMWRAGGMMIQHMPKQSPLMTPAPETEAEDGLMQAADIVSGDHEENWSRVNILVDTSRADELAGPDVQPTEVLVRLFHDESPRAFDPQPIAFGCTCSEQRVKDSLAGYSKDELVDLITEAGTITADCQFCGRHYEFMPDELGEA